MRRILLVDDEANVLSALQRALRRFFPKAEVEIETFTDPEPALMRCAQVSFDVVMSDYRMPGLTGADFLQMVKGIDPDAVRLVLSASTDFSEIMDAVNRAEVFRYVAKPWDADELKNIIALAFERRDQALAARGQGGEAKPGAPQASAQDLEARRLEAEEPGITRVRRASDGSVYLD